MTDTDLPLPPWRRGVVKPVRPARPALSQDQIIDAGLRIVAAAWVVCFHFSFTPGDTWTWSWEPLRPLVASGGLGVDLFFVLSGFVITLTYLERVGRTPSVREAGTFLWARICRIWPVYALVTVVYGGVRVASSVRAFASLASARNRSPI